MGSIVALLLVSLISIVIVRVAATALELTGIPRDVAGFQATSAFFGVGFTTTESELMMNHPVRRRIIRDLIITGQLGVMTVLLLALLTLVSSFEQAPKVWGPRIGVLLGGLLVVLLLTRTRIFGRVIDRTIRATLLRAGAVRALDYERLLAVRHGYSVSELLIEPGHWLAGNTLGEAQLRRRHGVVVLGVMKHAGGYEGAPHGEQRVEPGDTLVIYGADENLRRLASVKG